MSTFSDLRYLLKPAAILAGAGIAFAAYSYFSTQNPSTDTKINGEIPKIVPPIAVLPNDRKPEERIEEILTYSQPTSEPQSRAMERIRGEIPKIVPPVAVLPNDRKPEERIEEILTYSQPTSEPQSRAMERIRRITGHTRSPLRQTLLYSQPAANPLQTPKKNVHRFLSQESLERLESHLSEKGRKQEVLPLIGDQYRTLLAPSPFKSDGPLVVAREEEIRAAVREAKKHLPKVDFKQFGPKLGNCVLMGELLKILKLKEPRIPTLLGVSTDQIHTYLKKNAPEVFDLWADLGKVPFSSPEAESILSKIALAIEAAFAKASPDLFTPELVGNLAKMGDSPLMVRSTGAEDGKKTPNAGGNLSVPYVPNQKEPLSGAIGAVVGSYFGRDSLANRIGGGTNPFQEELSLAAMLQEVVGEPVGGEKDPDQVPVSFVMFTNEPLYIHGEKFRCLCISATCGHGEGIVSSQGIHSDTYYILRSEANPDRLYIIDSQSWKSERLAPVRDPSGKVILDKIPNPVTLAKSSALKLPQLIKLYTYGVMMEELFDGPTDIEGAIKGGEINFFQGRPVVRKNPLPTYLNLNPQQAKTALFGTTVTPGSSSALIIGKKEEVLFGDTIDDAEKKYLRLPPEQKGAIKLVLVAQIPPPLSHPVVNFKSTGTPSIRVADLKSAEALVNQISRDRPLAVCTQRGSIALIRPADLPDLIKQGFAVHPLYLGATVVGSSGLTVQTGMSEELRVLISGLYRGDPAAVDHLRNRYLKPLAEAIKHFSKSGLKSPGILERLEILNSLHQKIEKALNEVGATLSDPSKRMNFLLHIRTLESCIGSDLGYSLRDVPQLIRALEIAEEYRKRFPFTPRCIDLLFEGLQVPHAFEAWREFLAQLEPQIQSGAIGRDKLNAFSEVVATLKKTGSLPFWMSFLPRSANGSFLNETLQQIGPQEQSLFAQLIDLEKKIEHQNGQINRFADPKAIAIGCREVNALIPDQSFLDRIEGAAPIARSAAYRVLEKMVNLIDTSIKIMKGSSQFTDLEKVREMKEMLIAYYALMSNCVRKLAASIPMHIDWPLERCLILIRNILIRMPIADPEALLPSADFSVSAAIIGSLADFSRHRPQSLEDLLTLMHQNTLAAIAFANKQLLTQNGIQTSHLPEPLKQAVRAIEARYWRYNQYLNQTDGDSSPVQRIGTTITSTEIVFDYNVPVRNHSGHLSLHYDLITGKMCLKGKLLGQARTRWRNTSLLIDALESSGVVQATHPFVLGNLELSFSWEIKPGQLEIFLEEYDEMVEFSLGFLLDRDEYHICFLERWRNRNGFIPIAQQLSQKTASRLVKEKINQIVIDGNFDSLTPAELVNHCLLFASQGDYEIWQSYCLSLIRGETVDPERYSSLSRSPIAANRFIRLAKKLSLEDSQWLSALFEFQSKRSSNLFGALIVQRKFIDRIIPVLNEELNRSPNQISMEAIQSYLNLVENGFTIEESKRAAKAGMSDPNPMIVEQAVRIYIALAEKGEIFPEMIEAASRVMLTPGEGSTAAALRLYKILVEKGHAITNAVDIVREEIAHKENEAVVFNYLDLCRALFKKKAITEDVIKTIAFQYLKSTLFGIGQLAKSILSELTLTNREKIELVLANIPEPAHQVWINYFKAQGKGDDYFAQRNVEAGPRAEMIQLLDQLPPEEALWLTALFALERDDVFFMNQFIAKKQHIERISLLLPMQRVRVRLLLHKTFVENGYKIAGAAETAVEGINESIRDESLPLEMVMIDSLKLLQSLVAYGHSHFDEALKWAQYGINSTHFLIRTAAFDLYKTLVEEGKGVDEAISALFDEKAASQIPEFSLQQLLDALLKKGLDRLKKKALVKEKINEIVLEANFDSLTPAELVNHCLLFASQGDYEIWESYCLSLIRGETVDPERYIITLSRIAIVANRFIRLAKKLSLEDTQWLSALFEFQSKRSSNLFGALIVQRKFIDRIIPVLNEELNRSSNQISMEVIQSYLNLVETGFAIEESKRAAKVGMSDPNPRIVEKALRIYTALAEKGEIFPEMIEAAVKGTSTKHSSDLYEAIALFKVLVEKGHALTEAKVAAENALMKTGIPDYVKDKCRDLLALIANKTTIRARL